MSSSAAKVTDKKNEGGEAKWSGRKSRASALASLQWKNSGGSNGGGDGDETREPTGRSG